MDPFYEAINACRNDFEKIIENGKYDLRSEMLITVWEKYNKQIHGVHFSHFFQEEAILDRVLRFFDITQNRADLVRALLHIYRTKVLSIMSNSNTIKATRKILEGLSNEYVLGVLSNERARVAVKVKIPHLSTIYIYSSRQNPTEVLLWLCE